MIYAWGLRFPAGSWQEGRRPEGGDGKMGGLGLSFPGGQPGPWA